MTFIQDMLSDITNMSGYDLGTTWCGGASLKARGSHPGVDTKDQDASITYTK